jgi:hypothetical protein
MKELIGKTVTGLRINDDQSILTFDTVFETTGAMIAYMAEGDCCSETWFADITGVDALIGGTVTDVSEISMTGYNVDDGRCRQEFDQAYGYKIVTNRGYCDIVFRNSSNGYYGGGVAVCDLNHYGAWNKNVVSITDDWSA